MLIRADEPNRYQDAPVSLQLVGRRYEDEKVSDCFSDYLVTGPESNMTQVIEALEFIKQHINLPFVKL